MYTHAGMQTETLAERRIDVHLRAAVSSVVDAVDECGRQATQRRARRKNEHGGATPQPMVVLEFGVGVHVAANVDPVAAAQLLWRQYAFAACVRSPEHLQREPVVTSLRSRHGDQPAATLVAAKAATCRLWIPASHIARSDPATSWKSPVCRTLLPGEFQEDARILARAARAQAKPTER